MYHLPGVREECERLQKNFEDLRVAHVSVEWYVADMKKRGGEMDAETARDYFALMESCDARTRDVEIIIDGIDQCDSPVSLKRALCASLSAVLPRSTTIMALDRMGLLRKTLRALAPAHRRSDAAVEPASDAMLCYLESAIHVLGAQRRNTALLVCAVLAHRGPRPATREVESQLLSAVGCGWGDAERLAQRIANRTIAQGTAQATMERPFIVDSVEAIEWDYMMYPGIDAAHIRMVDEAALAYITGSSPDVALARLLSLDYPISGQFLERLVNSVLWMTSAPDPAVQALLDLAPLSAFVHLAKIAHLARSPVAVASRMNACSSLWDVLSPTSAVDMALFAPGAMATLSPHHPVGGRDFMARMRATWGHVARAFCAYIQHLEETLALMSHDDIPIVADAASPVKMIHGRYLHRYFSAEEAAEMLLSSDPVHHSVYEYMIDVIAGQGKCALLFTPPFLMRLARIGGTAMRRLCDSLTADDWTAMGDTCTSVLYFTPATVRHPYGREALIILAEEAPTRMKRCSDATDGQTAAERLAGMREVLPEWDEWDLEDLLNRLTPSSLAKRAHMQ